MLNEPPYSQAPEAFLRTARALFETYACITAIDNRHVESLGLTPAQFDVLATLGDTPGMTCKQLGEGTLITKGTLTGVLDRLESKGLVHRCRGEADSRQVFASLTPAGEEVFKATFQPHIDYMAQFWDRVPLERQSQLIDLLRELQAAFRGPSK
ncbi:Transcriptional regulator HosA [compost metagenome]